MGKGMGGARSGKQTTLAARAAISGVGVHSGREVSLTIHPAEADNGITFLRTSVCDDGSDCEIPADFRHVSATDLCTTISVDGAEVATIEHLMATFGALGVDNAVVEIDGPEIPVMDGSAADFIAALDHAGLAPLSVPRNYLKVLKPVRVEIGHSHAEFRPHDTMRVEVEIDFPSPVIGQQRYAANVDADSFRRDLARARTFGFLADVERLWSRGLALGASLDNAVVIGEDRVINPEGLRFEDEFVRHKTLDAIGDLALVGAPILGCYSSYRGGHRLNVAALKALIADQTAWAVVNAPVHRDVRHGELERAAAPAFGPDAS
jgi:UDP-3-O-[3-hydroxymyristoyl] N-acetylglucosamine deacetylase